MKKSILTLGLLLSFAAAMASTEPQVRVESNDLTAFATVNSFCKLIQMGDYNAVKTLIERGEDVNRKSTGLTPLMFAARHNQAQIAELLINNGAKLNSRSEREGMTALQLAERYKADETYEVIKKATDAKKEKKNRK